MTPHRCDDHPAPLPLTRANVAAVVDSQIRPLLHIHGGDLELVSLSDEGVVHVRFHAACRACPLKAVTYAVSIRQRLMEIPGVTDVVMDDVRLSRTAIARVEAAYRDHPLDLSSYDNVRVPAGPVSETNGGNHDVVCIGAREHDSHSDCCGRSTD